MKLEQEEKVNRSIKILKIFKIMCKFLKLNTKWYKKDKGYETKLLKQPI